MPGRILSKKNESALRSAAEQLAAVLALLDTDEGDDDETAEMEAVIVDPSAALRTGDTEAIAESVFESDFMPLVENAVRRDGTMEIRVMSDGWGTSGYYPAEVLERDGPHVFGKGTKMFIDHPTPTEEAQRPERSVRDLAAELVTDARWVPNHPKGSGLYADAKVFETYQPLVEELAPHIGVSIRAMGKAKPGEIAGRKGQIIQELTAAKSIDLVTEPGANGRIIQMFEAARRPQLPLPFKEADQVDEKQFVEALAARDTQIARLSEALILRDAKDFVRERVALANVPDVTRARLVESLSANPPVQDGTLDTATYATRISEAIAAEVEYLTKAAGYGSGRVEGMGGTSTQEYDASAVEAKMVNAFERLGLNTEQAKSAAGRK